MTCSVDSCDTAATRRGLCPKHYFRWYRRAGDLTVSLTGMSLEERFNKYVAIRGEDGCWEWQGSRHHFGYGNLSRAIRAHRYAWERANGPIPPGKYVCHSCDNPPCCNVAHLFLGTHAQNMADAKAKGRIKTWRAPTGDAWRAIYHPKQREICRNGLHPLVEGNLVKDGKNRRCKTCREASQRRRREYRPASVPSQAASEGKS